MSDKCIVCSNIITKQNNRNYCNSCGSNYDSEMNFIPSRHNWNLEDYSKSFLKDFELSRSKHQS